MSDEINTCKKCAAYVAEHTGAERSINPQFSGWPWPQEILDSDGQLQHYDPRLDVFIHPAASRTEENQKALNARLGEVSQKQLTRWASFDDREAENLLRRAMRQPGFREAIELWCRMAAIHGPISLRFKNGKFYRAEYPK